MASDGSKSETDSRRDPATYPFQCRIPTRFGDMDALGHINNVAIARIYEEARVQFHMNRLGRAAAPGTENWGTVVVDVQMTFLKSVTYPATLEAGVGVGRIGRSSFTLLMALFEEETCVGTSDVVTVITQDGKAIPIPDDIRTALEKLEIPSGA